MATIKVVGTEISYQVSEPPVWRDGVWECGNIRFVDVEKVIYETDSGSTDAADPAQ